MDKCRYGYRPLPRRCERRTRLSTPRPTSCPFSRGTGPSCRSRARTLTTSLRGGGGRGGIVSNPWGRVFALPRGGLAQDKLRRTGTNHARATAAPAEICRSTRTRSNPAAFSTLMTRPGTAPGGPFFNFSSVTAENAFFSCEPVSVSFLDIQFGEALIHEPPAAFKIDKPCHNFAANRLVD